MIIKTYLKKNRGFHGQDADSWAKSWGDANFPVSAEAVLKDHLSPIFKKYFPRSPKKILEGGCGTGKYVFAYRKLGYDIVGVDFASDLIRRIKEIDSALPVYEADITKLPFEDGYFDCYYSGGVIEHFEEGPDRALREARRVLKTNGLFLVTVPFINVIRTIKFMLSGEKFNKDLFQKKVIKCEIGGTFKGLSGYDFCEYSFNAKSLMPYFKKHGFRVEKIYATDILWGEIGLFLKNLFQKNSRHNTIDQVYGSRPRTDQRKPLKRSLIKDMAYDFFVTENRDNMLCNLPLLVLTRLSGHMALFVARAV